MIKHIYDYIIPLALRLRITIHNHPHPRTLRALRASNKIEPPIIDIYKLVKEYYPDLLNRSGRLSKESRDLLEKYEFSPQKWTLMLNGEATITDFHQPDILRMIGVDYKIEFSKKAE